MKAPQIHLALRLLALLGLCALIAACFLLYFRGYARYTEAYILTALLLIFSLMALMWLFITKNTTARGLTTFLLFFTLLASSGAAYAISRMQHMVRITLVNTTELPVLKLTLEGCDAQEVGDIGPGQSITLWLPAAVNGCGVTMHYVHQTNIYIKTLYSSLRPDAEGQKFVYRFGKDSKPLDAKKRIVKKL